MQSIYRSKYGKEIIINYYDSLLTKWVNPSNKLVLENKFGNTFIIESGEINNPPLILLHGTGSNSLMWMSDTYEFSKYYHVFAIDIIGDCGKSSENRPDLNSADYSDWLLFIITSLKLNKVSIIGYSFGGWIALDFASKFPEKILKLVLLATAGVTDVKLGTLFWLLITSVSGKWGFNKLNKMVYGNIQLNKIVLDFVLIVKKFYKPRTDRIPKISDISLNNIDSPVLFIGGDNDCFFDSMQTAARLKQNINEVQCLILKNTNHIMLENLRHIIEFLNK